MLRMAAVSAQSSASPGRSRTKGAVNLQLVRPQLLQVGERRIAGAEVVDHEGPGRGLRSAATTRCVVAIVAHQRAFGELELQLFGAHRVPQQRGFDDLDQPLIAELLRRDVDRGPAPHRGRQHAIARSERRAVSSVHSPSWHTRPDSSATPMKLSGNSRAAGRMVPAHQRLAALHRTAGGIDHRLVMQYQFVLRDAARQGRARGPSRDISCVFSSA